MFYIKQLCKIKNNKGIVNFRSYIIPLAIISSIVLGYGLNRLHKGNSNPTDLSIIPSQAMNRPEDSKRNAKVIRPTESLKCEDGDVKLLARNTGEVAGESKVLNTTARFNDTEKSLSRIKSYIRNIEEQNRLLQEKNNTLNSTLEMKEKELAKLNQDNLSLKENLDKAIQAQSQLKVDFDTTLNNLKGEIAQKDSKISALESAKLSLEQMLKELDEKLSTLSNGQASLENQIRQAQNEKSSLESQLNNIKEELSKQATINDTLNKKTAQLTESLNSKESERENLVKKSEQLEAANKGLEAQLSESRLIKANNEVQIAQLNLRINELNSSYEELTKSFAQLTNLLAKKESEISERQNELFNIKSNIEKADIEKETALSTVRDKERLISEMTARINSVDFQLAELQKTIALKESEIDERKNELISIKSEIERVHLDRETSLAALREREKKISELTSKLNSVEPKIAELQKVITFQKEQLTKKDKEIDEKQNELTNIESNIDKSKGYKEDALLVLRDKEKRISELTAKLNEMQPKLGELQRAVALEKELRMRAVMELEFLRAERRPKD